MRAVGLPSVRARSTHHSAQCVRPNDSADAWAVLPAVPVVVPAYVRPTNWARSHFLQAKKWPCLPVRRGAIQAGAWVVLQSVRGKASRIVIDANRIVRRSVRLEGVHPYPTSRGEPVMNYRPSLHDMAVRFPVPYATVKSRMVYATGGYRVPGISRYACFVSTPLPTCKSTASATMG